MTGKKNNYTDKQGFEDYRLDAEGNEKKAWKKANAKAKKKLKNPAKTAAARKRQENHAALTELGYLHFKAKGREGGTCLLRHESYKENDSCSHRWQSAERARSEYDRIYKTSTTDNPCPRHELFSTQDLPWPNEAHHIVPCATLTNAITNTALSARLRQHIIADLMEAPFNINHYKNMITLPANAKQSAELGLPAHWTNHFEYDSLVKTRLNSIFSSTYKKTSQAAEDKYEDHKDPPHPPSDVARQIVALQENIYKRMTSVWRRKIRQLHLRILQVNDDAATKEILNLNKLAKSLVR